MHGGFCSKAKPCSFANPYSRAVLDACVLYPVYVRDLLLTTSGHETAEQAVSMKLPFPHDVEIQISWKLKRSITVWHAHLWSSVSHGSSV